MTSCCFLARRTVVVALVLSSAAGLVAGAQSPSQASRGAPTSRRAVRAELAATLLNANRFSEAAVEYRRLLAAEPRNRAYRLGLARALAWGDRPRDAERELLLARDARNAAVVEPLLRSVRAALDPTAVEAAAWLRASPDYLPYRVALARALAREDPRRSIAQFDTLRLAALAGAKDAPPEALLVREEADAYVAMGARPSAITLLGGALDKAPRDTALRRALAITLFDAKMLDASRAQYDTLIATAPTATAYVGRANAALALGDTVAAAQDLSRSITLAPNYAAYASLAAMARDDENFVNARLLYDAARRVAPDAESRRDLAVAYGQLARDERPVAAFAPDLGGEPGWTMTTRSAADNARVSYISMDAGRAAPISGGFVSTLDIGMRRIAQSGPAGAPAAMGTAASFGLARQIVVGRAIVGGSANAGFVTHPGIATFGRGSVTVGGWYDAWNLALGLSREPAYEALFTPNALSLGDGVTPALVAKSTTISGGGPIGRVDAAARWTRTWLSDGNAGQTIDIDARAPLGAGVSPHLFVVYEGNITSYAAATTLYWDPIRYVSNAIGPEIGTHHLRGLSMSARVLAGFASATERDTLGAVADPRERERVARDAGVVRQSALQLTTAGEASYRAAWWEAAADVAYGRSRAGQYQRLSAALTIRVLR
jgi:tetratricopeptide (TPR) repeat protein